MKKILHTFILFVTLGILGGCGDFLDNPPKGFTIPSKCEDYEQLLNSQSFIMCWNATYAYFSDDIKLLNKEHKASKYNFQGKYFQERNVFSFNPGQIFIEGDSDGIWNNVYAKIFTYNVIINNVMSSKGSTETEKLRIKSEALVGRAFEYFGLVNIYSKHYDAKTAATDYGVPYITEGDINQTYTRATVGEVYKNILADLEEASKGLAEKVPFTTHPSKSTLYSFYAKLYLFMGDYPKALENANKALAANDKLLNLNDYSHKDGSTWDRVTLKTDPTKRLPDIDHPEVNYYRTWNAMLQGVVMLSEEARANFKKDVPAGSKDLRKEYYTAEDKVSFGSKATVFPGECAYTLYFSKNVGFTSAENYYIAAECEARIGSKDRAMDLLNAVRKNRFENYTKNLTAATKEEALTKVLEDKRREFLMSPFRVFDLKRLNLEPALAKDVTHSVDGNTWVLKPNSLLYIFPVSTRVLEYNPDMPQYDRK